MRKGLAIGLAILGTALPASAQDAGPQALQITAANVTAAETGRDAPEGLALPGDVIEYSLLFTNVTDVEVLNVQFTDPLPEGVVYVLGTASADRSDVTVDYSIDGGTDWSEAPEIEVAQPDGRMVLQPAPAEAYTHIRWTVTGPVAVGAQVTARFRVQMPGTEQAVGS